MLRATESAPLATSRKKNASSGRSRKKRRRRLRRKQPDRGTTVRRFCDRCMKVHEHGERCPKAPKRAKRPDTRHNREAHRRSYATAEYKRNRQSVLTAHKGRCAKCGKQIAVRSNGAWVMRGGDIHHICALSEGGTNRKANLVPLCHACHAQADAARRRAKGSC